MAGELRVNFKVDAEDAKQQGQQAGAEFGKGMNAGLASQNPMAFMAEEFKRLNRAGVFNTGRWGRSMTSAQMAQQQRIRYEAMEAQRYDRLEQDAKKAFRSKVAFFKDLTFLFQPLFNPTSVWGNMFAARQTFSAFSTEEGQRRIGGGGAAGALRATAMLQSSVLAIGLALKGLSTAIKESFNTIEFSRRLFGKALSGGMSLGFTANRAMTADVLGVPESEIFRFKQSGQIMNQLSGAVMTLSKNAPQLAYTGAQIKILGYNLLALGSDIATKLSPVVNSLIKDINGVATGGSKFMNDAVSWPLKRIKAEAFADTHGLGIKFDDLKHTLSFTRGDGSPLSKHMEAGVNKLYNNFSGGNDTLGQPQTFMRQMQAGAFEKMGLVVGSGGKMMDYARRTAVGVEKLVNKATQATNNSIPRGYTSVFNPISNMP